MKSLKLIVASIFAIAVLQPVFVAAQNNDQPVSSPDQIDQSAVRGGRLQRLRLFTANNRQDRIATYKQNLTDRLTTAETNRLRARCQAAQAKLKGLLASAQALEAGRLRVYESIESRLTSLIARLQTAGHSDAATELQTALGDLTEKIDAAAAANADFIQVLSDLSELACQTDPEAFKAALQQARSSRVEVFSKIQAVRVHIVETVLPLLQSIKTRVGE